MPPNDSPCSEPAQTAYKLAADIQEHINTAYKLAADVREHIIESAQPDDPLETTDSIMAGVDACENLRRLLAPYVQTEEEQAVDSLAGWEIHIREDHVRVEKVFHSLEEAMGFFVREAVQKTPAREAVAAAVEQLDQLTGVDYEADHNKADAILLAVLDGLTPDVSDAYRELAARASNWPAA